MKNAALCIPLDYTVTGGSPAVAGTLLSNVTNDEPGLVYSPNVSNDGVGYIDIDMGSVQLIEAFCVLGIPVNVPNQGTITISVFSGPVYTGSNNTANYSVRSYFSGSRSADRIKAFAKFPAPFSARYLRVQSSLPGPNTFFKELWRILFCRVIQPGENISIGAEEGVDDRSVRRYARNGRRVIDPTTIVPTFQGSWPWLEDFEFVAIRRYWRSRGATLPALLVLDTEQDSTAVHGGEDGIFYGDVEKTAKLGYEDGAYSFSFAIVSIAS